MRTIAEHATHRLVFRRRLPPPFAGTRIYTSTEGGLRFLRPDIGKADTPLLRLAAEVVRRGDVVWDIGANMGLFSFAAAAAAGRSGSVLAVEPDAVLVRLLRRSAACNTGVAGVQVLPAAVADELAVARFHVANRNRATSHLDGFGTTQTGGIRATELVLTVTLDWLATNFPVPDVIKIDVEGAEMKVLAGAARVLARRPAIICEVAGCNSAAVARHLAPYGYTLYEGELAPAQRAPLDTAPPSTLAFCHSRSPAPRSRLPLSEAARDEG
jgi:FkbM family methyltransferase